MCWVRVLTVAVYRWQGGVRGRGGCMDAIQQESSFKNVIRGGVMSNLQQSCHQTGVEVDTSVLQIAVYS